MQAGLYRVSVSAFARRPPALTITVDGSAAITVDPAAAALTMAKGGGRRGAGGVAGGGAGVVLHRHPAGSVAGLSCV